MHLAAGLEPDPQFFEECWTRGVPGATLSLERRRQQQLRPAPTHTPIPCTPQARASETGSTPAWTPHDWRPSDRPAQRTLPHGWMPQGWQPREDPPRNPTPINHGPMTLTCACQLLGVTASDTRDQIRSAFRRRCNLHHPDLHQHSAEAARRAHDRMAELNQAYTILRTHTLAQAA